MFFSVGCLYCLQSCFHCLFPGRLLRTEGLYWGTIYQRAGSPSFDTNLGQKTVVSKTTERLYPQRMINRFSSDASCQADANQVTLGVSALGPLLYSKALACSTCLILNIWWTCRGSDTMLWELDSTALGCCGGLTTKEMVSSLVAIWHVSLMAWPVCSSLNLVCWVRACNLLLNRCSAASFHFLSNTLLPSLRRHLTLICLKTAWLLLFQENSHVLELSHLFHLFAAWFFSFCYTNNQGLSLWLAFRSKSRPVSTRQALLPLQPSIPPPSEALLQVCVCRL